MSASHTAISIESEPQTDKAQPENTREFTLAIGVHAVIHIILLYHCFTTSPSGTVLGLWVTYITLAILHGLVYMYKLLAFFIPTLPSRFQATPRWFRRIFKMF
jgi:hypothetical protein